MAPTTRPQFHPRSTKERKWTRGEGNQSAKFWAPHPSCKTCTHVSYQQISILTLNFNTSFVGHLTNVATLEYFTWIVFFSVFVERCSRVWLGCIERYTWLAVFDENTRFLGPRCVVLLDPAKTLVSHLCIFVVSFLLCLVSVSVFGTIQRR